MRARLGTLLALALGVAAAVAAPASAAPERNSLIVPVVTLESALLAQVNGARRERGLAALRPSSSLAAAATAHTRAMGTRGFFSHESADGSPFWHRVARFYPRGPYREWWVGENLLWARSTPDPRSIVRTWLASPSHRSVVLAPRWREVGLSAVRVDAAPGAFGGHEVVLVTADFGVRR